MLPVIAPMKALRSSVDRAHDRRLEVRVPVVSLAPACCFHTCVSQSLGSNAVVGRGLL